MPNDRGLYERLADFLEGAGAWLLFGFFGLLPIDVASACGGLVARAIGPHLGITKRARLNIGRALPDLSEAEVGRVIREMWENIGRVLAEYPHIGNIDVYGPHRRVDLIGADDILANRSPERRYIFFSAHFGNWEIATIAATQAGFAVAEIYRAINNPIVDQLIQRARARIGSELIPKGKVAARRAIAAIEEGRQLCMLVDQKMNDGIAVPFFGRDAMTAPALARLALRFNCTVVPVQILRTRGAHFRMICDPPLTLPHTGDRLADQLELMTEVNRSVERWIRARPELWFGWLHRRWPD